MCSYIQILFLKIGPKLFTAKGTHIINQTNVSMFQNDSSFVYIVTINWTYKYHITAL